MTRVKTVLLHNILTAVDVFLIVDIHLHEPDQHAGQDTQEVQVSPRLTHLSMGQTARGKLT